MQFQTNIYGSTNISSSTSQNLNKHNNNIIEMLRVNRLDSKSKLLGKDCFNGKRNGSIQLWSQWSKIFRKAVVRAALKDAAPLYMVVLVL